MKRFFTPTIIISILLMLASSGVDGMYMAKWMPYIWMGLALNTAADFADLYLGSLMGKLMRSSDATKRWLGLLLLGTGQLIAVAYSWYFSYLQLRRVLVAIEGAEANHIALISAGFIPLLLAFLGIADGLDSFSTKRFLQPAEQKRQEPVIELLACHVCGATHSKSGTPFTHQLQLNGHMKAHSNDGNGRKPEKVVTHA